MVIAIQRPVMFAISMVLAVVAVWFIGDRCLFLIGAIHTTGNVVDMVAENDSCECGKGCRYDCTRYQVQLSLQSVGAPSGLWISAGDARGFNRPAAEARYRIGQAVPMLFNPRNPAESYPNRAADLWRVPLMILLFQVMLMVGSFTPKRSWFG